MGVRVMYCTSYRAMTRRFAVWRMAHPSTMTGAPTKTVRMDSVEYWLERDILKQHDLFSVFVNVWFCVSLCVSRSATGALHGLSLCCHGRSSTSRSFTQEHVEPYH